MMISELNNIICLLFEKLCALFYIEYCYMYKFQFTFTILVNLLRPHYRLYMTFKTHIIQCNK